MSKEKQMIEELAEEILQEYTSCYSDVDKEVLAKMIYNAGYRKQSEGEWIKDNTSKFEHRYNCSVCDYRFFGIPTPYCPNCGAKMKGV